MRKRNYYLNKITFLLSSVNFFLLAELDWIAIERMSASVMRLSKMPFDNRRIRNALSSILVIAFS